MSAGRVLQVASAIAVLVLLYAVALGSSKPLDLLLGAIVGSIVLVTFRRFLFTQPAEGPGLLVRRALRLPLFLLILAGEVVTGTWRVGIAVLSRRPVGVSGVIDVPMGERTDLGVAVSSLAISLTPGELVVDLDWERRTMLVHALDAEDPDRIRAEQELLYERYQRGVFP